ARFPSESTNAPPDISGVTAMPVSSRPATSTPVPASTITSRSDTTLIPTRYFAPAALTATTVWPTRGGPESPSGTNWRSPLDTDRRARSVCGSEPTTLASSWLPVLVTTTTSVTPMRLCAAVITRSEPTTTPEPTALLVSPVRALTTTTLPATAVPTRSAPA